MAPEVLMYVQSIRKFVESSEAYQDYFAGEGNFEEFMKYVSEMSQKNFEENGEPELTIEQFEEVRELLTGKKEQVIGIFMSMGDMGYISLN